MNLCYFNLLIASFNITSNVSNIKLASLSVIIKGGLIFITFLRSICPHMVRIGMDSPKYIPCSGAIKTISSDNSVNGSLVSLFFTNSTPMNKPSPRTSPITSYSSCISNNLFVIFCPIFSQFSPNLDSSPTLSAANPAAANTGLELNVVCSSEGPNLFLILGDTTNALISSFNRKQFRHENT